MTAAAAAAALVIAAAAAPPAAAAVAIPKSLEGNWRSMAHYRASSAVVVTSLLAADAVVVAWDCHWRRCWVEAGKGVFGTPVGALAVPGVELYNTCCHWSGRVGRVVRRGGGNPGNQRQGLQR